ncbi:hypothetical protein BDV10DRAFT_175176 [Aspergillus recurvatus]
MNGGIAFSRDVLAQRDLQQHVNTRHITRRSYESTKANGNSVLNMRIIGRAARVRSMSVATAKLLVVVLSQFGAIFFKRGLLKHI